MTHMPGDTPQNPTPGRMARVKEALKKPNTWWTLLAIAAAALAYYKLGCPIRLFTGIGCPGCGMTRALWYAATLRFGPAFAAHPLFLLVPAGAWLVLFKWPKAHPRFRNIGLAAICAAFIVTYLLRMFVFHSPVVMPTSPVILELLGIHLH